MERGNNQQAAALVDLMEDDPNAADFVASIRDELQQREMYHKLFSRVDVHRKLGRGRSWWRRHGAFAVLLAIGLAPLFVLSLLTSGGFQWWHGWALILITLAFVRRWLV